jgi:hypothetical protein
MRILDNYKKILQNYKTQVIDEVKERVLGTKSEEANPENEEGNIKYPFGTFYNLDGTFSEDSQFFKNSTSLDSLVFIKNPNPSNVLNFDRNQNKNIFAGRSFISLGLTHNELLDRANWAYAESHGKLLQYYAHAINNSKKAGLSPYTAFSSEADFKKKVLTDTADESNLERRYPKLLQARDYGGNDDVNNPQTFWDARQKGVPLQFYNPLTKISGQDGIRETIKAILGISEDGTSGATNWISDGTKFPINRPNATGIECLKPEQTDGHTSFYKWQYK